MGPSRSMFCTLQRLTHPSDATRDSFASLAWSSAHVRHGKWQVRIVCMVTRSMHAACRCTHMWWYAPFRTHMCLRFLWQCDAWRSMVVECVPFVMALSSWLIKTSILRTVIISSCAQTCYIDVHVHTYAFSKHLHVHNTAICGCERMRDQMRRSEHVRHRIASNKVSDPSTLYVPSRRCTQHSAAHRRLSLRAAKRQTCTHLPPQHG